MWADDCRALLGGSSPPLRVTCRADEGAGGAPSWLATAAMCAKNMEAEQFEEKINNII